MPEHEHAEHVNYIFLMIRHGKHALNMPNMTKHAQT